MSKLPLATILSIILVGCKQGEVVAPEPLSPSEISTAEMEPIRANTPTSKPVFSSVKEVSYVEPDGAAPRAVDAHDSNPENWAGILVTRAPGDGKCTSTLVGRNTILTAAHCVDRKDV